MKKIIIEYFMWFVLHWKPWFSRGGAYSHGFGSHVFTFSPYRGDLASWDSFRVTYYVKRV